MSICTKGVFLALSAIVVCLTLLAGCKGGHRTFNAAEGEGRAIEMKYAENLKIEEASDYTLVTIRNPWDTTKTLQRYLLVDRHKELPKSLPEGIVIKVPVSNALVYSTVHTSIMSELGSIDAIGGICNAEYVNDTTLKQRLQSGRIADCGMNMSPNIERIIKLNPEVVMLSPFESNDKYAKVGELGIPIIECADHMETTPLGRAEWVRFYGLLFGKRDVSEKMFAQTESRYLELKKLASSATTKPKVILDQRYGQVWNVPAGKSTMGRMIEDAGGTNPFARFEQSGSVPLAPEKVLAEAHDAPIWLVRYYQDSEKSKQELASDAPINSEFKAFKDGDVFGCNTRYFNFFEETAQHPDYLLEDMVMAIHPEIAIPNGKMRYFHKMK